MDTLVITDRAGLIVLGGVITLILAVLDIRLACLVIILCIAYYVYLKFFATSGLVPGLTPTT